MNIKEHIEAGHYPRDEKGRALVPAGRWETLTYTIVCTDRPGKAPILGFCPAIADSYQCWNEDGGCNSASLDLLPPPPRKVARRAWVLFNSEGVPVGAFGHQFAPATPDLRLVELTGSYEEQWS